MEKKGESDCVFPAADVSVSPGAILSVPPVKLAVPTAGAPEGGCS